ncbi:MAG TPA: hypothetical protein VHW01_01640 [Polyangiaceae bacterium]|nr:hypothetical protein [Polyangiaceae bacterium]
MKRARLKAGSAFATLAIVGFSGSARAAGPDPAAETQRLLTKLDAPDTRSIVQDPVAKAKAAEQRAQNARGAGDLQHATELDTLALTWAQVADDLVRTAAAEKTLSDLQKTVTDLEQKAVRTQALIEQTIARRGRAEQNLANEVELTGSKKAAPNAATKPAASKPAAAAKPKPSAPAGSKK